LKLRHAAIFFEAQNIAAFGSSCMDLARAVPGKFSSNGCGNKKGEPQWLAFSWVARFRAKMTGWSPTVQSARSAFHPIHCQPAA
jgi:hypothetical protein